MSKLEGLEQSYGNMRESKVERRDACKLTIKRQIAQITRQPIQRMLTIRAQMIFEWMP
jgi:hypothetical protein